MHVLLSNTFWKITKRDYKQALAYVYPKLTIKLVDRFVQMSVVIM